MWLAHTEGTIRHVWPQNEEHDTESMDCPCNPKTQMAEGGIIIVTHNSADGREYIERLVDSAKDSVN